MPKINQEEYEILKNLDDKWKWIARDESYNELGVYLKKPARAVEYSGWTTGLGWERIDKNLFLFIQWEDEEPHNIQELIAEYEFGKILLVMAEEETILEIVQESEETEMKFKVGDKVHVNYPEYFMPTEIYTIKEIGTQFNEKSIQFEGTKYVASECQLTLVEEETETKDIKWLTKEVDYQRDYTFEKFMEAVSDSSEESLYNGHLSAFQHVAGLLNQLDEPTAQDYWPEFTEFLAHERVFGHEDRDYLVVEKPVIPQFVADFIKGKEEWALFEMFHEDFLFEEHDDVAKWLYDGEELRDAELVLALKCGYEVEEEPKYFVRDNNYLLCKYKDKVIDYVEAIDRGITDLVELKLTEKEIKDYDERYLAFKKQVEDLSE